MLTAPAVPECVQEGIGRNDAALAAEQGVYQGKAALLVVLPDASDVTRVTAYIVDATCVENTSPSTTAKVLLEHPTRADRTRVVFAPRGIPYGVWPQPARRSTVCVCPGTAGM